MVLQVFLYFLLIFLYILFYIMLIMLYLSGMNEKRITLIDKIGGYHKKIQSIRKAWIETPPSWMDEETQVALMGNKGITATLKILINRAHDTLAR